MNAPYTLYPYYTYILILRDSDSVSDQMSACGTKITTDRCLLKINHFAAVSLLFNLIHCCYAFVAL